MERVLDEIKSLNEQTSSQRQQKSGIEDEINETQYERSKMEQKLSSIKQKKVVDEVKLEQDLKTELDAKKLQLE